jgi:hypothetical protein
VKRCFLDRLAIDGGSVSRIEITDHGMTFDYLNAAMMATDRRMGQAHVILQRPPDGHGAIGQRLLTDLLHFVDTEYRHAQVS